jgi:hypothetical protein
LNWRTIRSRIAAVKLGLSLIAQLAQCKLLLGFELATESSIFAICLTALGQFIILVFVQAVDLTVKVVTEVFAGIFEFRLTRCKYSRRGKQEGPKYKGISFPMFVHRTCLPGRYIGHPGRQVRLVMFYEDWLRRLSF